MKQIVAIVKPFLAEKVITAVSQFAVDEISIREVKGFGRQKHYLERYGENEYALAHIPKVEIAVWTDDELVEEIVATINSVSRTGRPGDGQIMILPIASTPSLVIESQNPGE